MTHVSNPSLANIGELYQDIILEHAKRPRFKGLEACQHRMPDPSQCATCLHESHCVLRQEGYNPSCGDSITLQCSKSCDNKVDVCFDGHGCSICLASASIMCSLVHQVSLDQAKAWIQCAEAVYTGQPFESDKIQETDLEALVGVSRFPARVKCAALAWKTLEVALNRLEKGISLGSQPVVQTDK